MKSVTHEEWEKFLEEDHKIKREVWLSKNIGFDSAYLYIPIKHPNSGEIKYKRRRSLHSNVGSKYMNPQGCPVTLYPSKDILKKENIIICEGELDTLTAESFNIPAITSTGGAAGFKKDFLPLFEHVKKVYIVLDTDDAGYKGSLKIADLLSVIPTLEIYIVDLSVYEGVKDIGDFFKLGHTREEFVELCSKTKKYKKKKDDGNGGSGTETPQKTEEIELIEAPLTYKQVEEKVEAYLPQSSVALKITFAVVVSGYFENKIMLWLLLVGVPSSGKTDLVRLFRNVFCTYYIDSLTQNAFISGEREVGKQTVFDLLAELNKKCLIVKDWTSIFSHDEKVTKKILGDLVGIYDKEFSKFSSRRGRIVYSSEFSQIGCITPATLNKHTNYMNMVGPRFLCYIIPELTEEKRNNSFDSIFSNVNRADLEIEAKLYVASYMKQLTEKAVVINPFSSSVKKYLKLTAELIANCRGMVVMQSSNFKNEQGEDINYYEVQDIQIEEPWRALQQIISLAKYLAFIQGRNEVTFEELQIVKDVALCSMPANRAQTLITLINHQGLITAKQLSDLVDKSIRTSRRLLEELSNLKVIEKLSGSGTIANDYFISDKFKDFLIKTPAEFLSHNEEGDLA